MPKMLKREEVADLFRVHVKTIDNWVALGAIPHVRIGRSIRFDADDLAAAVARHRCPKAG